MAVPPAPDGDAVTDPSDSTDTTTSPTDPAGPDPRRARTILIASFAVVLVCLVASLVALGRAGWSVDDLVDEQTNPQTSRDQAMAVARGLVTEFSRYGPDDLDEQNRMPGYVERVEKYLTPKFATAFQESVQLAEQTVAQAQVTRVGQVYAVGVERIDEDSARVMVAGVISTSIPDPEKPQELTPLGDQPFRFQVDLIRTQGEWLVDNFGAVGTLDGQAPQGEQPTAPPTGAPSGSPSGSPRGGGEQE